MVYIIVFKLFSRVTVLMSNGQTDVFKRFLKRYRKIIKEYRGFRGGCRGFI